MMKYWYELYADTTVDEFLSHNLAFKYHYK